MDTKLNVKPKSSKDLFEEMRMIEDADQQEQDRSQYYANLQYMEGGKIIPPQFLNPENIAA